ncbi:biotin/lipoyl-containing protein [Clostridium tagluense]|uniref:biotin/lipoyl-containing protein n=1 Tax=Clostridium tagluense TaxID=360422 RepID=UPI001C6E88FA|nr:biotin/lipoyl-containing protein [Clostridium tagluense]MBW9156273.1 biotin/lipoyl-binding protein [Clostridium tagluense]WLC65490.1 biotin/lipoyl-binding protein [Clostridium tagluense]
MNKYNIKVNGISYEVEVEEVVGDFASSQAPVAVTKQTPEKAKTSPKKTVSQGEKIECPMPGTVLKVNVKPGDNVKTGQVLFILEAMKMENEIMAPHDAKILEVGVTSGASVNTGDILAVIQ